jgi:hypothetical protein
MPNTKFEIPSDLIEAIEMSSFERQLPKQGCTAIHRFLIDPENKTAENDASEWIENQKGLWPEVDRVVRRLHEVAPMYGGMLFPEWHHQPWWVMLGLPWSNDLKEAIRGADLWCDKHEDAKSS